MGLFDAMNAAESGINVARYRTEVVAQNLANTYTDGYKRQVVDQQQGVFTNLLQGATAGSPTGTNTVASGAATAWDGAVRVTGTHTADLGDPRQNSLQGALDMMDAKDDYETNVRVTSLIKSMALAALEIGRGG